MNSFAKNPGLALKLQVALLIAPLLTLVLVACGGEDSGGPASAQEPVAQSPAMPADEAATDDPIETAVEAMTEANYRRHIETLASDAFGGRMPATPGEDLTVTTSSSNSCRWACNLATAIPSRRMFR